MSLQESTSTASSSGCSIAQSFEAPPHTPSTRHLELIPLSLIYSESKLSRNKGLVDLKAKENQSLVRERENLYFKYCADIRYDRSVDLIVSRSTKMDQNMVFNNLLEKMEVGESNKNCRFFTRVPIAARKRIYAYLFPDESRPISLSPYFATKDAFPKDAFASPWDVLENALEPMEACSRLRKEIMTYFWTHYHFHVTLSPVTSPSKH